jgi:hypothetical protein
MSEAWELLIVVNMWAASNRHTIAQTIEEICSFDIFA